MKAAGLEKELRETETSLETQIGNTALIRLRRVVGYLPKSIKVYAKAEHLNPGGSVKDRAALAMILAGEKSGKFRVEITHYIVHRFCAF